MLSEDAREVAQTDPPPPICRRLEHVRRYFGFTSLRSFWLELDDSWDEEEAVSYEAARKYHNKRRPPVRYVRRISNVFGVRLAWLISEEGEMLKPEGGDGRQDLSQLLSDRYTSARKLDPGTRGLLIEIVGEYTRSAPDWRDAEGDLTEEMADLGGDLLWWVTLPLRWRHHEHAWGFKGPDQRTPGEERRFVTAALAALRQIVAEPGTGRSLEYAEQSIFRRLRELMEARSDEEEEILSEIKESLEDQETLIRRRETEQE